MFYDEMNGYDFDLFFSGTEYDFQKLQQTFISLGVTPDQVRLIMRNELEDAEIKSNEIRELIEWLRENRNRQFDFDDFCDANRSLLEETFSCIVIRGKDEVPKDLTFSLENVKSVDEIAGTNLTYVPVVFVIEAETIQLFRNDLLALLGRKDVEQNQLFFCISPIMDKEYVVRFISDLGIEEPQIISRIDDGNVATYIKNYPMVAYVGEVIRVFEDKVNTLDDYLKAKNEQSLIENAEVYEQISELDDDEKKMFLDDLGIQESGLEKLIKASYELLGLMSYLTAGEDETRAWTIKVGTKAPQAAGKIHTDFERGFIKAEVVNYKDLLESGSYAGAREKGLVRMEGKEYVVKDGDVILFRFNV